MSRQVLIVQRRLPEYRVPFFDGLKDALASRGLHLVVLHATPTHSEALRRDHGELPWAVRVRARYFGDTRPSLFNVPHALVANSSLVIVPHELGIISNYSTFLTRTATSRKVAFWGHGPRLEPQHPKLRERVKAITARWADWWFAYTRLSVERLVRCGYPADRITCVNNAATTVFVENIAGSVAVRDQLRDRFGIRGPDVGISVGSLSRDKMLEFLIAAADRIRQELPAFELVIVGDGPRRELVRAACAGRPWLHWVGARHGAEKAALCSLAKVTLNPGMVGLGILDSFASTAPMITTEGNHHSPEICYLRHGENGLMARADIDAYASAVVHAMTDEDLRGKLVAGCREAAARYTVANMVDHFTEGVCSALEAVPGRRSPGPTRSELPRSIAVIYRHFLPYHEARLEKLKEACNAASIALHCIEVASKDNAYRFSDSAKSVDRHCCFPNSDYQRLRASAINQAVLTLLLDLRPEIVFAPATPFPEGMAAIRYRAMAGSRNILMDDAWSFTDRTGRFVRFVKRLIHRNIDGALIPSPRHIAYYRSLGIPADQIHVGASVVDNAFYDEASRRARTEAPRLRERQGLPERYFLFVGRFLERKGVRTLLDAYCRYRSHAPGGWSLVLVGGLQSELPRGVPLPADVACLGPRVGEELAILMGLAGGLVVPSDVDQWGLVVNEGMACGLPVIVSQGCGASSLIEEGVNGWTFGAGNAEALASALLRMAGTPADQRSEIGRKARETIGEWGLDRYVSGVFSALRAPRSVQPGLLSAMASRLWKGWVREY